MFAIIILQISIVIMGLKKEAFMTTLLAFMTTISIGEQEMGLIFFYYFFPQWNVQFSYPSFRFMRGVKSEEK